MQTEQINKQLSIEILSSRAYVGLRNYLCVDINYETHYPKDSNYMVGGGTLHIWYNAYSNVWQKDSNDSTIEDLVLKEWISGIAKGNFTYNKD